jgi:hypothetical protein
VPSFVDPPSNVTFIIGRSQKLRATVIDPNVQHVVSVSVIGLQLLKVGCRSCQSVITLPPLTVLLQVDAGAPPALVTTGSQMQHNSSITFVQVKSRCV